MSSTPRRLHVANGTSTTRTIEASGIPGACSIWADPLYEGPVPAGLGDAELLDVRMRYLAGPGDLTRAGGGTDPSLDPVNDMRAWRTAIARHEAYDELILWFEHDLFDQLNLIQLLAWLRPTLPGAKPVSLICIGSYPGRANFKGLGELTAGELAPLFETREPVSDPQYRVGTARVAGISCTDARSAGATPARRHIGVAVSGCGAPPLSAGYPWTRDGLSRSERRLLELARGDGILLSKAFPRMHDGEETYYMTDASLAGLAEMLARTSPPLLTLDLSSAERQVLRGRVALTDIGQSALSGELDRVAACGIDRWLGGVHLQSGRSVWRWDDPHQHITEGP